MFSAISPRIALVVFVACATLVICSGGARAAEFTIEDWFLSIGVINQFPDIVGSVFEEVQNPFVDAHEVHLWSSSSTASYRFEWSDSLGSFLIEASQVAEGLGSSLLSSTSSGRIKILPTGDDLPFRVHGEYTYDLPVDGMHTIFDFAVRSLDGSRILFNEVLVFDTTLGGGSDTFVIDGEFTLPAGEIWDMDFGMIVGTSSAVVGSEATGSGFFDIQVGVPEPATGWLVIAALLVLCRRRR